MGANLKWELSKYPDVYESLNSKFDLANSNHVQQMKLKIHRHD